MLSVQPRVFNNYSPAFKSRDEEDFDFSSIDEDSYESMREDLIRQKNDLCDIVSNKEMKLPEAAKKVIKGSAVVTTGLLGGMATGWGAKKSMTAMSKILKSKPVQGIKNHMHATKEFIKKAFSTVKKQFLESDAYKIPANSIKKAYNKFSETKVGRPITKFLEATYDGIGSICKNIKKGFNRILMAIKGVKKESYEKATVNIVGTSGGIASGITALKENSKTEEAGEL